MQCHEIDTDQRGFANLCFHLQAALPQTLKTEKTKKHTDRTQRGLCDFSTRYTDPNKKMILIIHITVLMNCLYLNKFRLQFCEI